MITEPDTQRIEKQNPKTKSKNKIQKQNPKTKSKNKIQKQMGCAVVSVLRESIWRILGLRVWRAADQSCFSLVLDCPCHAHADAG
jgi:hypothetical protein